MLQGAFWAIVSAATFGLIPLFTLPLLAAGASPECILLYRFAFGSLILLPILLVRRERLRLPLREGAKLGGASLMYMLAALFYFHAFRFLPSGTVTTLQFLYPLMVMGIMIAFFHERFSLRKTVAVLLACGGVALLAGGQGAAATESSTLGVALALLCGLFYALYYVGLKMTNLQGLSGLALTFHVMVWGWVICAANVAVMGGFQWLAEPVLLLWAFLLALVTAVFSNLALILAIKRIGPTLASIFGAAEPFTAVTVGVLVFDEPFTLALVAGFALIVGAIMLVFIPARPSRTAPRQ